MPRSPRKTQDIRVAAEIHVSPGRVYRTLVSARELCVWWLDRAETEARSMGRFRMVWSALNRKKKIEATGVFVDLEPAQKVAWIWDAKTRPSGVPPLVTFFIEEKGKGCNVTLVHAGFSAAASRRRLVQSYREMWEDTIAKLKLYLESDRTCKGERLTLADVGLLEDAGGAEK